MKVFPRVGASLLVLGVLGSALVGFAPQAMASSTSDEQAFFSDLNAVRSSNGVAPLAIDYRLTAVAEGWSSHMAAVGNISHNPNLSSQVPQPWLWVGENVGMGSSEPVLNQAFINSPEHFANMVNSHYNAVGVGVVYGGGLVWVTVDFEQEPSPPPANPADIGASGPASPCLLVATDGGVFAFGGAPFYGSMGGQHLNQPIVGMASTADGRGYWLVASDGGIFAFGDARFFGSTGSIHLNQPIVGMAPTPTGTGYWLVARDGGMFAFGDARFFGSTGSIHLNQPIVGMASTPGNAGYWLVASDGGIFAFGNAAFYGSTGSTGLGGSVVGMAASPTGHGYVLAVSDGATFAFGDAATFGSVTGLLNGVVGIAALPGGGGYNLATSNGLAVTLDTLGRGLSSTGALSQPIVAITSLL